MPRGLVLSLVVYTALPLSKACIHSSPPGYIMTTQLPPGYSMSTQPFTWLQHDLTTQFSPWIQHVYTAIPLAIASLHSSPPGYSMSTKPSHWLSTCIQSSLPGSARPNYSQLDKHAYKAPPSLYTAIHLLSRLSM